MRMRKKASIAVAAAAASFVGNCRSHTTFQKIADDDAGGIVVGAFCITGRLYYQDRPQSQQFYATSEEELRAMAADRKSELISENPLIYRTDEWTLRIYQ